jgi:hypothetical protein
MSNNGQKPFQIDSENKNRKISNDWADLKKEYGNPITKIHALPSEYKREVDKWLSEGISTTLVAQRIGEYVKDNNLDERIAPTRQTVISYKKNHLENELQIRDIKNDVLLTHDQWEKTHKRLNEVLKKLENKSNPLVNLVEQKERYEKRIKKLLDNFGNMPVMPTQYLEVEREYRDVIGKIYTMLNNHNLNPEVNFNYNQTVNNNVDKRQLAISTDNDNLAELLQGFSRRNAEAIIVYADEQGLDDEGNKLESETVKSDQADSKA